MRRALTAAACCCAFLALAAPANAAFPGQGFLPDDRAWEMVSPSNKGGGYVIPDSGRTRAATDGSAINFLSLAAFGDAIGQGIATEYIAERSGDANPGNSGWSTHAITPRQGSTLVNRVVSLEPFYPGELSSDLNRGVFFSPQPLTEEKNVEEVVNLYRRTDLRTPGPGGYELISSCPLCELSGPLPPLPDKTGAINDSRPLLIGATPDFGHVFFQSQLRLTQETPAATGRPQVFEWHEGEVTLAGRIPSGGDEECVEPACVAAPATVPGQGRLEVSLTPHLVSDGSDGHVRVFLTEPLGVDNTSIDPSSQEGNLFVRTDATTTANLNASERDAEPDDAPANAKYWDATPDGTKVLFTTAQALTDDAPVNSFSKLYMYDTTKPASEPDNLTFLSPDEEPGDQGIVVGAIGLGADGSHAYFVGAGQLVADEPKLGGDFGIYMWHDGEVRFIAPLLPTGFIIQDRELISTGADIAISPRQARVTPDGRHLLFSTISGEGVLSRFGSADHDHGGCTSYLGPGCRELYLYDADADTLECVSCNPDGSPSEALSSQTGKGGVWNEMSSAGVRELNGGVKPGRHESNALSDDGRYAFFSTGQRLVPEDTNGTLDAYVYDSALGEPRLLSSGEDSAPSWFVDASADGSDAFIVTRERLSGWDVGSDFDLYDARVGGGFPEPPPPPPTCIGDACQPAPLALNDATPSSSSFKGPSDRRPRARARKCPEGKRQVKRRGKVRCVKRKARKRANAKRRAAR